MMQAGANVLALYLSRAFKGGTKATTEWARDVYLAMLKAKKE